MHLVCTLLRQGCLFLKAIFFFSRTMPERRLLTKCPCLQAKLKSEENTQTNLTRRFFSAPLTPLQNSLCLHFPTFQRENTARTQRISGVEGQKKGGLRRGIFLVKSLCLGFFFGLEKCALFLKTPIKARQGQCSHS